MRFISNEKLDEYCFKNRLIPPKLRRSLYASAEITGFQPPNPTTFRAIGNKNKLFELKYFQEFNQPESVKENVGLQIFNALQMLPKNEDSSAGRARQILADGVRYQAELTRENNIRVAKEKVSSEIGAVFKAKKARLEQAAEFLKQQEELKALEEVNQALKGLDEVANLAGVKIEPTPPKGPPPPGGLRGRGRSTSDETIPEMPQFSLERSPSTETVPETPGAGETKKSDPEPELFPPPPSGGISKMRRRTGEEKLQRIEERVTSTTKEIEDLRAGRARLEARIRGRERENQPLIDKLDEQIREKERLLDQFQQTLRKEMEQRLPPPTIFEIPETEL